MRNPLFLLLVLAVLHSSARSDDTLHDARNTAYHGRVREVLEWRATQADMSDPTAGGLGDIAAKLALRRDIEWASRRLVEVLKHPRGDMFWMFPVTSIAFLGRDQLSAEAQTALREAWRTYMPQRGDTENHWAMYYVSLYLMSELWPDLPGSAWYTGKSSEENLREAREYLLHWIDLTTTRGQGEYDCTHYIGEYCIPMVYLAAWAKDPAMRQRGRMMLDYILADFGIETLNGIWVGSHARTDDRQVIEPRNGLFSFFSWLFFANVPPQDGYGGWGPFFAVAAEHYDLPEVIHRIATDREQPYLHRELKRTRHRWRNSDVRNAPVYKTTFMTRDYGVGSDQGGLLQPIQQHSWNVIWAVDGDPRGVHNTLFCLNPHASAFELQMYFTEHPDWVPKAVTLQGKPTYMAADTFLGGSPYEQIHQEDDTVVVLYDIAQGAMHEHVNGFFSKDLARLEEDDSGWIFVQGGNAYIAYRPLAPYEWIPTEKGDRRLYSPHRKNGAVVQVASAREFESWNVFKDAIRALPLRFTLEPVPTVRFTSLRGREIHCVHGEEPVVDGKPVDRASWPLFGGWALEAARDSRVLRMRHGPFERFLDFRDVSITDRVHESIP
ncbi:hypothetical protein ASA1KI_15560 [Opitutales bacterium ASA1]|uniref:hypothetical protein n=1 Tax=Congregicoccus parvus TaxID=3081749 RepID=UPI002B2A65BE|nr:hypothetical protein ASA1KI_15560 [Opitutales bacterium ASA1]